MAALPVFEQVADARILKTTTAGDGTSWVKVGGAGGGPYICRQISVFNNTGTELQFAMGSPADTVPTGETIELPDETSFAFEGLSSSESLYVRRTDAGTTPVTFKAWGRR